MPDTRFSLFCNDGRYGVVETCDGADLRLGDRVKVDRNKIDLDFS